MFGSKPPIGRVAAVEPEAERLVIDVAFDQGDQFAREIERKYRDGFLNAVSVSWDNVEGKDGRMQHDLLEVSGVPVPADPDALIERQRAALARLGHSLITFDDESASGARSDGAVDLWAGIACAMLAIYQPETALSDDARRFYYNQLERMYVKLGRTAPEFIELSRLKVLTIEQRRGLWLEDEPDVAGAATQDVEPLTADEIVALRARLTPDVDEHDPEPDEDAVAADVLNTIRGQLEQIIEGDHDHV